MRCGAVRFTAASESHGFSRCGAPRFGNITVRFGFRKPDRGAVKPRTKTAPYPALVPCSFLTHVHMKCSCVGRMPTSVYTDDEVFMCRTDAYQCIYGRRSLFLSCSLQECSVFVPRSFLRCCCSRCRRQGDGNRCTYSKRKPHQFPATSQHQQEQVVPTGVHVPDRLLHSTSGALAYGTLPLKRYNHVYFCADIKC